MSVGMGQSLQLADYLEKLPGTTFRKLYQQPSSAFSIFRRMLPSLAKTFVMWMLYMSHPYKLEDLDARVKPEFKQSRDHALAVLRTLHMIQYSVPSKDRPQEIQLTTNFKRSMQLALEGGGSHNSFGVPSDLPPPPEVTIAFLDEHARQKFDAILHYIVHSVAPGLIEAGGPKSSVKELLLAGGMVRRQGGVTSITQTGFTFLLQEKNAQVWTLLLLWIEAMEHSPASGLEATEMLSFLFLLATLELGKPYDTGALTDQRRNMLPSLADFGLVYVPQHKPQQYFPTRLATDLTDTSRSISTRSLGAAWAAASAPASGSGSGSGAEEEEASRGKIIVETNFRLYAYTQNVLQIAVLSLFCRMSARFPDMVSGRLTRDSVRRAITFGITGDQIISYLAAHAHPEMHAFAAAQAKPVLPPTVVDQIRLWQLENERMKTHSGFLFLDFVDEKEYVDIASYADEIGVLVWRNDRRRMFFASKHEQIRDYLRLRKKA
ncbi:transcription factor tfb2 [Sodiomyces alkalinus F11]|uniref:RNA polymerase II transcription factor B subunit 2 n=1 Tax=Sodiomyces alkalinus (strain CBS 110278 / VKM F-3762 / F11) TaxID=1314773 RepID=A0A3N2Q6Y3_SODAK|nr:transcription factor tfb2 [Sodiomyces alkalinus F11]ROT42549.1 transcription factor tfb2 [Sodiomyces alkalinus F11]